MMKVEQNDGSRKLARAWMVLCAIVAFALCSHKAATSSFTHDESFSFLRYPKQSVSDLVDHKMAYTNNHLLNSLGMKASCHFFGTSELACRLPNLMALVIYLIYGALLLRGVHPLLAAVGYPLLFTNVYLMEFFTLARGYGLSFGFLLMALYHLWRAADTRHWAHTILFHLAFLLASWSNFTLDHHLPGGVIAFQLAVRLGMGTERWDRKPLRRNTILQVVLLLITGKLIGTPVERTLQANALDFGGDSGFYGDTVSTLVRSLFPTMQVEGTMMTIIQAVLTVIVVIAAVLVILNRVRRTEGNDPLFILVTCLVLTCAGVYLQHLLFGVDHLKGRFALFLMPMVVLVFIFMLQRSASRSIVPAAVVCSACLAGSIYCVPQHWGTYASWEWGYDMDTKNAMHELEARHAASPTSEGRLRVGINWLFEPAMNYYRGTRGLYWMEPLTRDSLSNADDYRYVFANDTAAKEGFSTVAAFDHSGTVLLKRVLAAPGTAPTR
ncbi:MAG: hypothetical protein IPL52_15460 [Flavobacteriales bacterium]|nr:hypothetical protein [Flavobacteriales bacterium]